jgi:hypothetical protein
MTDITTNSSLPTANPRPTLLTVLCILTFIGSAWGVISNIRSYINANALSGIVDTAMQQAKSNVQETTKDNPEAGKLAEKLINSASAITDPVKLKKLALYAILADILAFAGAFLMFNLRKTGFWVYLVHAAVAILAPVAVYGAGNMLIGIGAMFTAFVAILFSVLYSLNLKYMS